MTLAEAVETLRTYCHAMECAECVFNEIENKYDFCMLGGLPTDWRTPTETNLYDKEEIHKNCTVQILRNSVTGETSIGWYENK